MGDAAMVIALRDKLRTCGVERIGVIDFPRGRSWLEEGGFDEAVAMPESKLVRWRTFAKELRRFQHLFVIGADCLDGYYTPSLSRRLLEIGCFAQSAGCMATICGSSFNTHPAPVVVETLGTLPPGLRLLARDPQSLARMQSLASVPPELVADLAFLLEPQPRLIPQASHWAAVQKASGRRLLGVNVANAFLGRARRDETPQVVERFTQALRTSLTEVSNLSVILIPHDVRGERSDRALCEKVYAGLVAQYQNRVFLFSESTDPRAVKASASLLDASVTCRMHFGIACLGSGTPIAVVPYQDKFEGLFQHFEISPPALTPDKFFNSGELELLIRRILESAPQLALAIKASRLRIMQLALNNLGTIAHDPARVMNQERHAVANV